jgi:hypothetical protein
MKRLPRQPFDQIARGARNADLALGVTFQEVVHPSGI